MPGPIADGMIDISAIKNPIYKVKLPNGTIESYDPFELMEKILSSSSASIPDAAGKLPDPYPGTLLAAGSVAIDNSNARQPRSFHEILLAEFHLKESDFPGVSPRNVMLTLWTSLQDYMEGLEVTKKLSAQGQQNSSSSAVSSPANSNAFPTPRK